jgi:hypothetical protein
MLGSNLRTEDTSIIRLGPSGVRIMLLGEGAMIRNLKVMPIC